MMEAKGELQRRELSVSELAKVGSGLSSCCLLVKRTRAARTFWPPCRSLTCANRWPQPHPLCDFCSFLHSKSVHARQTSTLNYPPPPHLLPLLLPDLHLQLIFMHLCALFIPLIQFKMRLLIVRDVLLLFCYNCEHLM